jgi:hypothetical protein
MPGNWGGLAAQPGIEGWLPAAGLSRWEFNPHTGSLQNPHDGFSGGWIQAVYQAGDEKLDSFHNWHLDGSGGQRQGETSKVL